MLTKLIFNVFNKLPLHVIFILPILLQIFVLVGLLQISADFTMFITALVISLSIMTGIWIIQLLQQFAQCERPCAEECQPPSHVNSLSSNATTVNEDFKIMVVDDEPINLQMLINNLSLHNYAVIPASSGIEALDMLEKGLQPDLVLLDVVMPQMTGYKVTQKIRETHSMNELPIILLTAKSQISDLVTGFECGANDYITKPFAKDELFARIKSHLHLKQLNSELKQAIQQAKEANLPLDYKVEELTRTRNELVQREKMASLGRLVAGFAHELNTPIGVAVGMASALRDTSNMINELLEQEEVDEAELVSTLEAIDEAAEITLSHLKRAASVVNNFKGIVLDQGAETVRKFNVKSTIEDIIATLSKRLFWKK